MKYIRTSSGDIIDLSRHPKETMDDPFASKDLAIYLKTYGYGPVVKQSNSIEELCDEFVVCNGTENPTSSSMDNKQLYEKMKAVMMLAALLGENYWMKLAIWTYAGLIYVAEMNKEGEFELL